jgi:hypothetical protein
MTEAQLAATQQSQTQGITGPVQYKVRLGGREHRVQVEPA